MNFLYSSPNVYATLKEQSLLSSRHLGICIYNVRSMYKHTRAKNNLLAAEQSPLGPHPPTMARQRVGSRSATTDPRSERRRRLEEERAQETHQIDEALFRPPHRVSRGREHSLSIFHHLCDAVPYLVVAQHLVKEHRPGDFVRFTPIIILYSWNSRAISGATPSRNTPQ